MRKRQGVRGNIVGERDRRWGNRKGEIEREEEKKRDRKRQRG